MKAFSQGIGRTKLRKRSAKVAVKRMWRGHPVPDTTDPYELAGELMVIEKADESDEAAAEQYHQEAVDLIRRWKTEKKEARTD